MGLKEVISQVAPSVASVLGGPLAGVAVSFLADKLGVEQKTVQAVTEAISDGKMGAEQVVQIKLANLEFEKFCKQHDIDLEKIAADDRNSARQMQMATNSRVPATLTMFITAGFFTILGLMLYHPEVKESAPLMIMLGLLGTTWTGCCAYWFGTTNGSTQKTNLLAQSAPAK